MKWAVRTCQILPLVEYYHNWWSDKSNQIIIDGRIRAWNQIIIAKQMPFSSFAKLILVKIYSKKLFTSIIIMLSVRIHNLCDVNENEPKRFLLDTAVRCAWYSNACKKYSAPLRCIVRKVIFFRDENYLLFDDVMIGSILKLNCCIMGGSINKAGLAGALWKCSFCIWVGNIAFNAYCQSSRPGSQCARTPS